MKLLEQQLDLVEHQVLLSALDQIQIYGKDAKKVALLQEKLSGGFQALQQAEQEEKEQIQNVKDQLATQPEKPKHRFVK
jgi:hypothetical protein